MRMRRIVICGLSGPTLNLPHYLIDGKSFGKELLKTKFVLSFTLQGVFEKFIIIRRNERDIIINIY
jgi:hypothetical protein